MPNFVMRPPGRFAPFIAIAIVALVVTLAVTEVTGAQAAKTPKPSKTPAPKLVVLGASKQTANPACPSDPCQAIGKVTGFQTAIGGTRNPFVAPFNGRIVAWSIKLGSTTQKQSDFFTDFYGGPAKAKISVLKPRRSKKKHVLTLRAQGPTENLSGYFGTTSTFTLRSPLPVRKGQVVALTVPTWAPAFSIGLPRGNNWLASRKASVCNSADGIKSGSAQEAPGQKRTFGCTYTTARLLYSATVVPAALPGGKKKKKK